MFAVLLGSGTRVFGVQALTVLALMVLAGCAGNQRQPPEVEIAEPEVCEPEIVVQEKEILINRLSAEIAQQLRGAARASAAGNYQTARIEYEAVLSQQAGPHADAFALWGLINLFLNRDNPDYSREDALTVYDALVSRIARVDPAEPTEELSLVAAAVKTVLEADVSKDQVVRENRALRKELANREEAISRLREITVGQQ